MGRTTEVNPPPEVAALLAEGERQGLSPLALARAAGIHHSQMRRWQLGTASPTLKSLYKVAEFLVQRRRQQS